MLDSNMHFWDVTRHTGPDSLSTALDHGAYTANGITSYISSSSNATGQHAHGSVLDVICDEARHFRYTKLDVQLRRSNRKAKVE
jgi:hypothetical protein